MNRFQECGLFPLDPDVVEDYSKYLGKENKPTEVATQYVAIISCNLISTYF